MSKTLSIILVALLLLSAKDKPVKVNPLFLGNYYTEDSTLTWTLRASTDGDNKVDFYQANAKESLFTVVMKDSTHFKTPHDYAQTIKGQATRYWSAKGTFLKGGKMELAAQSSDLSAGLKFSFSAESAEKVIYTKR